MPPNIAGICKGIGYIALLLCVSLCRAYNSIIFRFIYHANFPPEIIKISIMLYFYYTIIQIIFNTKLYIIMSIINIMVSGIIMKIWVKYDIHFT